MSSKKCILTPRRDTAELYLGLKVAYSAEVLWDFIEALAFENNVSVSRLAINAGLDNTAFNVSKRRRRDGGPHWISSQAMALVLASVNMSMEEYGKRIDAMMRRRRR